MGLLPAGLKPMLKPLRGKKLTTPNAYTHFPGYTERLSGWASKDGEVAERRVDGGRAPRPSLLHP